MFKWLKEKKKPTKREDGSERHEDDYGFPKGNEVTQNDYGFDNNVNLSVMKLHGLTAGHTNTNDPTFHIYEEINELNEVPANQSTCTIPTIGSTNGAFRRIDNSEKRRSLPACPNTSLNTSLPVQEGPYMVVPIVNRENKRTICRLCGSRRFDSNQCSCHNRKLEHTYSAPWDSSASTCSVTHNSRQRRNPNRQRKPQRSDSIHGYVTSSSSEYSSGSAGSTSTGNDTCYEYDMSTSSESDAIDAADYKCVLEKVQHNLLLKEQVRSIIQSLSPRDSTSDSPNTTLDRTDSSTIRTISSLSGRSSVPSVPSTHVTDQGAQADHSESDDSGGYYECPIKNDVISGEHTILGHCSDSDSSSKVFNVSKIRKHKSRQNRNRFKYVTNENEKVDSQSKLTIAEDTELYLLPANKKDSCENIRVFKSPLLPPQQTLIYQNPQRSQTGSGNKLLCDLIRMNYDKQHMIHV